MGCACLWFSEWLIQLNSQAQNVFSPWREPHSFFVFFCRRYKSRRYKLRWSKHERLIRTIEAGCPHFCRNSRMFRGPLQNSLLKFLSWVSKTQNWTKKKLVLSKKEKSPPLISLNLLKKNLFFQIWTRYSFVYFFQEHPKNLGINYNQIYFFAISSLRPGLTVGTIDIGTNPSEPTTWATMWARKSGESLWTHNAPPNTEKRRWVK